MVAAFGSGAQRTPRQLVEATPRICRANVRKALPKSPVEVAGLPPGAVVRASVGVRVGDVEQRIEVVYQPIMRGRWRIYLICGECCERRHALFWHLGALACYRCHNLTYQCRTTRNRLPFRVAKLRRKIGAPPSLLVPLPRKPPHWRPDYYRRMVRELAVLEAALAIRLHDTVRAVRRRRPKHDRHSHRAT